LPLTIAVDVANNGHFTLTVYAAGGSSPLRTIT